MMLNKYEFNVFESMLLQKLRLSQSRGILRFSKLSFCSALALIAILQPISSAYKLTGTEEQTRGYNLPIKGKKVQLFNPGAQLSNLYFYFSCHSFFCYWMGCFKYQMGQKTKHLKGGTH